MEIGALSPRRGPNFFDQVDTNERASRLDANAEPRNVRRYHSRRSRAAGSIGGFQVGVWRVGDLAEPPSFADEALRDAA